MSGDCLPFSSWKELYALVKADLATFCDNFNLSIVFDYFLAVSAYCEMADNEYTESCHGRQICCRQI